MEGKKFYGAQEGEPLQKFSRRIVELGDDSMGKVNYLLEINVGDKGIKPVKIRVPFFNLSFKDLRKARVWFYFEAENMDRDLKRNLNEMFREVGAPELSEMRDDDIDNKGQEVKS